MAVTILGLDRVSLTSADADRLARFYVEALGFTVASRERAEAARFGVAGGHARVVTLALGDQILELVQFDASGAPYPEPHTGHDPWFQHIAIVVRDIAAAYRHVLAHAGCIAISHGGPATLPASSGGVIAIKLRDPELHPFELLQFPADAVPPIWRNRPETGPCLGIDHSAIVVSDTARSIAFYAALGLSVTSRSLNRGAEQAALDGTPGAEVEVSGLSPADPTPHVELLCYRAPPAPAARRIAPNDIAATRLVMRADHAAGPLSDPDGHRLILDQSAVNRPRSSRLPVE